MTTPKGYYEGLGASVCAAILGQDPHKSPYGLWCEFTDPDSRPNLDDNEAVEAGVALEPAIAAWAGDRLGVVVSYRREQPLLKHATIPFMQCHPDALIIGEDAGMEVKNRGLQMMRLYSSLEDFIDDSDRAQVSEVLQCHASMAVTGYPHWYLAVAVGGQKLLTFTIKRDEEIVKLIEERYTDFWGYVQRREPPPPINVEDCARLWPAHRPNTWMEADPALADVVEQRRILKAKVSEATDSLKIIDFRIKSAMKDVEELRVGGKKVLTWKQQHRKEYTVEAQDIRVMR